MGTGIVATTAATLPVQWPGLHGFATGVWVQAAPDAAFGGWLMPVVPPMVSAATGALLVPHLPAGQLRLTLLLACYAMFGLSLIASLVVITQLWRRLVRYSVGPAAMVPTLGSCSARSGSPSPPRTCSARWPISRYRRRTAPRSRRSASSTASPCGASPRCGLAWPPR